MSSILTMHAANVRLFDNLGAAVEDYDYVNQADAGDNSDYCPCFASFSTTSAASLTDVKVELQLSDAVSGGVTINGGRTKSAMHHRLRRISAKPSRHNVSIKPRLQQGTGSVSIDLFADASGEPGTLIGHIGSVADTALTSSPAAIDFPLSSPISLNASTRYWIGVSTSDGSDAAFDFAGTPEGTGTAGEFYWDSGGPATANTDEPFIMQVNATVNAGPTPTPAPATLLLMLTAIGAGGLYLLRRRLSGHAV